jgi:hypothetical protein
MSAVDPQLRPVGFGIRAFLLVATHLAFLGGSQVTLLARHTWHPSECSCGRESTSSPHAR